MARGCSIPGSFVARLPAILHDSHLGSPKLSPLQRVALDQEIERMRKAIIHLQEVHHGT